MALLTKEAILKKKDLPTEEVNVPEWKGKVKVITMTGKQRDAFEMKVYEANEKDLGNFRARLCVATIVDENNIPVFTFGDMEALGRKSGRAIGRVFDVAKRLNGIGDDTIEEIEKNLPKTPGDDLSST